MYKNFTARREVLKRLTWACYLGAMRIAESVSSWFCVKAVRLANQATVTWVYPTCLRRGLLEATGALLSCSSLPPLPSCSSVRKALGNGRSRLGVPRARVPLLPARRWTSPGWVLFSACGALLVVWLPCSAVCPGFVLICLRSPNSSRTQFQFTQTPCGV